MKCTECNNPARTGFTVENRDYCSERCFCVQTKRFVEQQIRSIKQEIESTLKHRTKTIEAAIARALQPRITKRYCAVEGCRNEASHKYCGNPCKQKAYRIRKSNANAGSSTPPGAANVTSQWI